MIEKISMPQLGESVTEGTITAWLKQPGDDIRLYDPICEVSTDKVNAEVPATVAGTLVDIIAAEGATAAVGDVICTIEKKEYENAPHEQTAPKSETKKTGNPTSSTADMKKRYSPAVRRLAQAHAIDLQNIEGSGLGGRVTRKDVLTYIQHRQTAETAPKTGTKAPEEQSQQPHIPVAAGGGDREIDITPVRRKIAERMVRSKHDVPHAWMMVEADVTRLVQFRQSIKDEFKKREGIPLTYMPFFIKAVVESIKKFPRLNAVWAKDKIIEKGEINISVAVAGEESLHVPVIHRADRLSIFGIAKALNTLVQKALAGDLTLQDTEGGTFTVNNTGTFGSIASAPIINIPQSAIITIESIVKRPVIVDNAIAIRDMVNFCLSLDHRLLDGSLVGKFMQSVKEKMESYGADTQLY